MEDIFSMEVESREYLFDFVTSPLKKYLQEFLEETKILPRTAKSVIKTYGSCRYEGEKGKDIDIAIITESRIDRIDFFKYIQKKNEEIKNNDIKKMFDIMVIPDAYVPILTFKIIKDANNSANSKTISVDLVLIRTTIDPNKFNERINILNDGFIIKTLCDEESKRSISGLRSWVWMDQYMEKNKYYMNYDIFMKALKVIKEWARRRQIYGAKYGYPGGIAWCFMLFDVYKKCNDNHINNENPIDLLFQFFETYCCHHQLANWKKKNDVPIIISINSDHNIDQGKKRNSVITSYLQIWTPTIPDINSTYSVSKYALKNIIHEFEKLKDVVKSKDKKLLLINILKRDYNIFDEFTHFIKIGFKNDVIPEIKEIGLLQSRLHKLTKKIEKSCHDIESIRLLNGSFHDHYFIGIKNKQKINLTNVINEFKLKDIQTISNKVFIVNRKITSN